MQLLKNKTTKNMEKPIKLENYLLDSGWSKYNEEERKKYDEMFNKFKDFNREDLFYKIMNMTQEELQTYHKKEQYDSYLREIGIKYHLFPEGWEFEEENGELFISDYYFDFDEIENLEEYLKRKKILDNIFKWNVKENYFNYRQIKDLVEHIKNSKIETREVKRIVYTYLMTDASGYVKIGKAHDIHKRFLTLRIGNPTLRIIAHLDKNIETELHKKYAPYRFLGEWFELPKLILDGLINEYEFSIH